MKIFDYLIEKSYFSDALCKFTSMLAFLFGKKEIVAKILKINKSHCNFQNRYLLKKFLKQLKKSGSVKSEELGLAIDSINRLYDFNRRKEITAELFKLKLPENLPFGYCESEKETVIEEINSLINDLSKIHKNNLLSNQRKAFNKSQTTGKIVEIILYDYILDKDSPLGSEAKYLLTRVYKSVLGACIECGYGIMPEFSYHWSCNKDTETGYNLCIGHHFKTGKNKHLIFKRSYLHDYIYFDKYGFSGWSEAAAMKPDELAKPAQDKVEAFYEELKEKYLQNNLSKYGQSDSTYKGPFAQKMIFCALQTTHDTVARLSHIKTLNMVKQVVNFYKGKKDTVVIIKRHPHCNNKNVEKYLNKISGKVKNIVISDASIHSLIDVSSLVIVANSGVGFEALMHLKPVVVTAETDYAIASKTCKSKDELLNYLKKEKFSTDEGMIKRFLYVFLHNYNICLEDKSFDEIIKEKIEKEMNKTRLNCEV